MGRIRIARRELASLRSEKTIVLALVIQLFVAGFSSFLLVGLVSLYDPGSTQGGGIDVGIAGEAGDDLADSIEGEGDWRLTRFGSETGAREAFRNGRLDAVFLAETLPDGTVHVESLVPDGSVRSTVIVVRAREALTTYERSRRADLAHRLDRRPLPTPGLPDAIPTVTFTYTVLLPLLVFMPAFISGSTAADALTEEVEAGTLELLRVTPLTPSELVDGKLLAMVVLGPVQAGAWLGLLRFNGTSIADPVPILGLTTAVTLILVGVGGGLAVALGDRQSTQLVYSLSVLVLFAAATLLPESPPNTVAKLAIGSATVATYATVAGTLLVATILYVVVRRRAVRSLGA